MAGRKEELVGQALENNRILKALTILSGARDVTTPGEAGASFALYAGLDFPLQPGETIEHPSGLVMSRDEDGLVHLWRQTPQTR